MHFIFLQKIEQIYVMTLFNQQTTFNMEHQIHKIWTKMWADYVIKKCKFNPNENWEDTADMRFKISIYRFYGFLVADKYTHIVLPNADNHICAKILQKHNIKMISLFVSFITKHIVVKLWAQTDSRDDGFFGNERQMFIDDYVVKILLVTIHERQCELYADNNFERCFADNYLLSRLVLY